MDNNSVRGGTPVSKYTNLLLLFVGSIINYSIVIVQK